MNIKGANEKTVRMALKLMQLAYLDMLKQEDKFKNMNDDMLVHYAFPSGWYNSNNYDKKMKLLKIAFDNKISLMEVEGISYFEEGVKKTLED